MRTRSYFLGTADQIFNRMRNTPEPHEVQLRSFGMPSALLQTAREIGLIDILKNNIPEGTRFGVERWKFFLVTILNRPCAASSKEKTGSWAASTVLPDLLNFDPERLNSKSYWYATDDVISEAQLRKRREDDEKLSQQLFTGLDDAVFCKMENELAGKLIELYGIEPESVIYDTTNFFTYIEAPARSAIAATGHNKDSRHHLRQVGLALCADKQWGIPLFHRIYHGASHDSRTFSQIVSDMIVQIKNSLPAVSELVLVLDKGNNSKDNFEKMKDRIQWIGSLVSSHHPDLLEIPLAHYKGEWRETRFLSLQREVMGVDCKLILTYNPALARKQAHTLRAGVEKLKHNIQEALLKYKRPPKDIPKGVRSLLAKSRYGKFISVEQIVDRSPVFHEHVDVWTETQKHFGKNLLFTTKKDADEIWVIEQYRYKVIIEKDFELLKSPDLIWFRPLRHWTDTKIRAFGYCCVASLVLLRVMLMKCEQSNLKMSALLLKQELDDLKEVIMIYDQNNVKRKISSRSSVQERLCSLFNLYDLETQLTIHKPLL